MKQGEKLRVRHQAPGEDLQSAIVALLQGRRPGAEFDPSVIDAALRRYECGGYLHRMWSNRGAGAALPACWSAAFARAHRKTVVDNLAALADFRSLGGYLEREKVPFVLLKGAAYLVDLYADPGSRALTDIDILLRPGDAARVARYLAGAGYRGITGPNYPEDRRFEMFLPGEARCVYEFHWWLGLPLRMRIDQDALWSATRSGRLEGVRCRLLSTGDALLYHVGHLADHYFGPSLKWVLDLREMLRQWRPDMERIRCRSREWRVRVALYLALHHLSKLFPDEVPLELLRSLKPGRLRNALLSRVISPDPAELMQIAADSPARFLVRPLLLDSTLDAVRLSARVMLRPAATILRRLGGRRPAPWDEAGSSLFSD